jgi:hypothetical protein
MNGTYYWVTRTKPRAAATEPKAAAMAITVVHDALTECTENKDSDYFFC